MPTRDVHATTNYSNRFCNYSDNCLKTLAIIGRQENYVAGFDFPAIEIYYYSLKNRRTFNYFNPTSESVQTGGLLFVEDQEEIKLLQSDF